MLAIRMQRLGRKGHPTYRVVVQDVRQTPTSGKYVALLGSYDPHAKTTNLIKEKAEFYLTHGAQPSDRVVRLFSSEGIAMPSWVKQPSAHTRTTRHADKLRKNRSAEEVPAAEESAPEEPAPVAEADVPAEEEPIADAVETPETAEEVPETPKADVSEASDDEPAEDIKKV